MIKGAPLLARTHLLQKYLQVEKMYRVTFTIYVYLAGLSNSLATPNIT